MIINRCYCPQEANVWPERRIHGGQITGTLRTPRGTTRLHNMRRLRVANQIAPSAAGLGFDDRGSGVIADSVGRNQRNVTSRDGSWQERVVGREGGRFRSRRRMGGEIERAGLKRRLLARAQRCQIVTGRIDRRLTAQIWRRSDWQRQDR